MSIPSTPSHQNHLRHHAVIGQSAEALRMFYEYFGFTKLLVKELPDPNYIRALTGGSWSSALILKLKNANGDVLEIIEPTPTSATSASVAVENWSHIAFTVAHCDNAVHELVLRGARLVGEAVSNPGAPYRVAYLRDPAGNLVEIVQSL